MLLKVFTTCLVGYIKYNHDMYFFCVIYCHVVHEIK